MTYYISDFIFTFFSFHTRGGKTEKTKKTKKTENTEKTKIKKVRFADIDIQRKEDKIFQGIKLFKILRVFRNFFWTCFF